MWRLYWKCIGWFFRIGVILWFLVLPALPIYNWLLPWPEAEQKLDEEGVRGVRFMIGSGGDGKRKSGVWLEARQRSYIVFPDSLRGLEIFTYSETKGSDIPGVQREIGRSRFLIPLLLLWILAGWYSAKTVRARINRRPQPAPS